MLHLLNNEEAFEQKIWALARDLAKAHQLVICLNSSFQSGEHEPCSKYISI